MIPVRSFLPFLLLVTSFACRSNRELPAAAPDSGTGIELFRAPARALHVDADLSLGQLLARYTSAMGWTLEASEELRKGLADWHCYLDQPIDIPPARVHTFVESMLRSHGLFLEFAHAAPPVVLRVITPGSSTNLTRLLVPAAEIPRWGEHPAHFIAAELRLPSTDTKRLALSLHFIFSEPELVRIAQMDDEGRLAVSGPGTDVASLLRIVAGLDEGGALPADLPRAQGLSARWLELLREPRGALHLESDTPRGVSIEELLSNYAKLMGWQLMLAPDVRDLARSFRTGLVKPIDVPAADVHAFVEGLLRSYGFVLRFAQAEGPVVLEVGSVHVVSAGPQPGLAPLVEAEELSRWADHPSFLVQTRVRLPGVDLSALPDTLRGLFSDFQPQRMLPLGGEQLLLTGFGSDIAQLIQVLRALAEDKPAGQAATPQAPGDSALLQLFATPAKPLHIEEPVRGELMLGDVLEAYAQLLGWQLLVDPETRDRLRGMRCSLALPLDVPAERVHAFVESIAQANSLVFSFAHAREPVLLQVQSLDIGGRGAPRKSARVVPAADLPRWSSHPAILVSTLVELPGVDVRTLSNSLRQMFSDQQTQQIIPLGNSNTLLVTGFGSEVAALASLFQTLSASAAGVPVTMPAPVAAASVAELFVTPPRALHLEKPAKKELMLRDLVDAYAELMGWRVLVGPDTANMLRTVRCSLALPLDVQPENVHAFVEGVLKANDCLLHFAHAQDPVLLEVESTNVAGRGNPRKDALMIPAAELPRWAAHPGFLVTTCIDLPGVDVRTLSNSLRQMFSDQQTQQIIPVGNTDGLIVTGFGSDVADITTMLRSLSDAAAGVHAPLPPISAVASGIDLLVPPARSLHLEKPERRELKLFDLLDQYAQLMGWRLLADSGTRNQLVTLEFAFTPPLDIQPEAVHSFVQSIARANDLVFDFASTCEPVLLRVSSTNVAGKGNPRKDANFVRPDELPRWAAQRAFLITTCVDLPGVDVRTLSNSLRQQFSDQQTQQIIPVGNSDGLILTGFAPDVIDILSWLVDLSHGGLALQPPPLPAATADDRARLFPPGAGSFTLEAPDGREADPLDVLAAFGKWSQRPPQISEAARAALQRLERKLVQPQVLPAQLVYPYIGVLLESAGCTLLPAPSAAPLVWAIDIVQPPANQPLFDWPAIPLEELTAWGAYCATPFRARMQLEHAVDPGRLRSVLRLLDVTRSRGEVLGSSEVLLWGTPKEIQAAAGMMRQACEPAPGPH